jgi:hypothetical protein
MRRSRMVASACLASRIKCGRSIWRRAVWVPGQRFWAVRSGATNTGGAGCGNGAVYSLSMTARVQVVT